MYFQFIFLIVIKNDQVEYQFLVQSNLLHMILISHYSYFTHSTFLKYLLWKTWKAINLKLISQRFIHITHLIKKWLISGFLQMKLELIFLVMNNKSVKWERQLNNWNMSCKYFLTVNKIFKPCYIEDKKE